MNDRLRQVFGDKTIQENQALPAPELI